jgi:hypothetical protein
MSGSEMEYDFWNVNEGAGSLWGMARSEPHHRKVKHLIKNCICRTFRIDQRELARGIRLQWISLKHSETYSD